MLDALVAGTTDPAVLAKLAKGRLRGKLPHLREALEDRFGSHHALVIGAIIAHLDFLDEHIDRLSDAIEEQLGPFAPGIPLTATSHWRRRPRRPDDADGVRLELSG
jgi:transposase